MKKLKLLLGLIFLTGTSRAAFVSHNDYTNGSVITASGQNTNENAIIAQINGNIDNTNICAGCIATSNIANNAITTGLLAPAVTASFLPAGVILPYGAVTAPSGFLLCNGQAVSRTTYSALFAIIGTSYGSGDSVTTFNVPDMTDKVAIGTGTLTSVGTSTGTMTQTFTVVQNAHSHLTSSGNNGGGQYQDDTSPYGTSNVSHAYALSAVSFNGATSLPYQNTQSVTATNTATTIPVVTPSLGFVYIIKT